MTEEQVKKIAIDVERDMRNESHDSTIASFNKLFDEHKQEEKSLITQAVNNGINGQVKGLRDEMIKAHSDQQEMIDDLKYQLNTIAEDMKSVHDILITARGTKTWIAWGAGVFGGLAVIGGAFKYIINWHN